MFFENNGHFQDAVQEQKWWFSLGCFIFFENNVHFGKCSNSPKCWFSLSLFLMFFESNGHFGKYSNKPSRAGGGVLGEGERIYPLRLYAWSSILFIL